MKKITFDNEPLLVVYEGSTVRINFDVEQSTESVPSMDGGEDTERTVYNACVVRISQPISRDKVIDAIISADYPNDKMQAIVNNYLLNTKDAEHKSEFDAMQVWRAHAKEVAYSVMAAL